MNKHIELDRLKIVSGDIPVYNIPDYLVKDVVKELYYDSFVDSYP